MTGTCGNGKTTMMAAIHRAMYHIFKTKRHAIPSNIDLMRGIQILSAKDIVQGWIAGKRYLESDILMIDDLGHEPTEIMHYGMILTPLIDILERRYARQKTTIISSNLTVSEIAEKYKYRIADRLEEMMDVVEFSGDSFRF